MKHKWSIRYLDSKLSPRQQHEWRCSKCREFENKTRVPWSATSSRGYYVFLPYLDFLATEQMADPVLGKRVLEAATTKDHTKYMTFLAIAETTELPLLTVMEVSKYLNFTGKVMIDVNRMGKCVFIRAK